MYYNEQEFSESILRSYENYRSYGPRSTKKVEPIHGIVSGILRRIFGEGYQVHYIGDVQKELRVKGKYYDKTIDVAVTRNEKPIICLGIKFVTSNYKQNSNNYFENMMGETANIQVEGLPYFQLIILRHKTPYYSKSMEDIKNKKPTKVELIGPKQLEKYIKLAYDNFQPHRPYAMGILLVDLDEKNRKVNILKPSELFDDKLAFLLEDKLSLDYLFSEIKKYKDYIEFQHKDGLTN